MKMSMTITEMYIMFTLQIRQRRPVVVVFLPTWALDLVDHFFSLIFTRIMAIIDLQYVPELVPTLCTLYFGEVFWLALVKIAMGLGLIGREVSWGTFHKEVKGLFDILIDMDRDDIILQILNRLLLHQDPFTLN